MSKLQMDFTLLKERLAQLEDGWTNGGFEWLDGMLVQALQAGDWLLMDNANFCRSGTPPPPDIYSWTLRTPAVFCPQCLCPGSTQCSTGAWGVPHNQRTRGHRWKDTPDQPTSKLQVVLHCDLCPPWVRLDPHLVCGAC